MINNQTKTACAEKICSVTTAELPLSCPTHDMAAWNAHPRVYLPIEATGEEICPYCGTKFVLEEKKK